MTRHTKFLYLMAILGFAFVCVGILLGLNQLTLQLVGALVLANLGAAILFPIVVSIVYDNIRERWMGDEIWRIFCELTDGGIIRIFKDRKGNAQSCLMKEFDSLKKGKVDMIGVSLRLFFDEIAPFYTNVRDMLYRDIRIQALICDLESTEVCNRSKFERDPTRIFRHLKMTSANVSTLQKELSSADTASDNQTYMTESITLRHYTGAPYCTAIIFPDKCYFTPHILCREAPDNLPMIVFSSESSAYKKIKEYFDHLWKNAKENMLARNGTPEK